MLLTREDDWKEVKLCRLFSESHSLSVCEGRRELSASHYAGHIGGVKDFFKKLDAMADSLERAVFIADGAKWIWNWVSGHYPDAVEILDFYHGKEKIAHFARESFAKGDCKAWVDEQDRLLLEDENGVSQVRKNVEALAVKGLKAVQSQRRLLTYLENNSHRMKYKSYLEAGYLIGSEAIESAHRAVIQSRMKLSGQRWTIREGKTS